MVTETKSPSQTMQVIAGWLNPTRAYSSDNLRTSTNVDGAEQEYSGYGFNVSEDSVIEQVAIKVECYSSDPNNDDLTLKVWNGSAWKDYNVAYTATEQMISVNVSDWIDTAAKLNGIKTRIKHSSVGGCFPPETVFLSYDGKSFELKPVVDISVGDGLLGFDGKDFVSAKVTKATIHKGLWDMVRAYVVYPESYVNATCKHAKLKELMSLVANVRVLCDACWTENHPVWTRNRGEVSAGELRVGDLLGEIFWDGKVYCGGLPVDRVERFEFEGEVYDVRAETRWIFGRYLLGHFSKT